MKRLTFAVTLLLLCISFPTSLAARNKVPRYLNKESSVDMSKMDHVFIGWVDLEPDSWGLFDFHSKADWADDITFLNAGFLKDLQATYLNGRIITAAKNKDKADESATGENASGNDLYIKFSDVHVDYDHEHLVLSIRFIDPKTNNEIASIPVRPYYGDGHNVTEYLKAALDEVGTKLQVEVTGEASGKKKK